MEFEKDKQLKIVLELLCQNLAYTVSLAELLVAFQTGNNNTAAAQTILAELEVRAKAKTLEMKNRLFEEFGDIGDALNS